MKRLLIILIVSILHFSVLAQSPIPKSGIGFKETGKIKTRSAKEITASDLGVGCEVLGRGYAYYDGYKEYLGELGVKHARFQSSWAKTEKEKGYYDFTWLDPIIDDCISRGIQPWFNIGYGNPIYPGGGDITIGSHMPQGDTALKAWDAYVYNLVDHYKTRVFEWEIWNEPNNHHDPETGPVMYADLFIRTAEIIKEIQPEGKTIALAIGYYALDFVKAFFDRLESKGKVYLVDVACMHGYPQNPDDARLDKFIELVSQYDDRITFLQGEAGAPSAKTTGAMSKSNFSELIQAKWDLRRSLVHIGRGIPHSQFAMSDMKYPRGTNRKGLLRINDHDKNIDYPKQAYFAYQYLTSIFDFTVEASPEFSIGMKSDKEYGLYPFTDRLCDKPLITYWHSEDVPNNNIETQSCTLILNDARLNAPVLIDIRTGLVYEIPGSNISQDGNKQEFQVPVYDSPLLICEKKFLLDRNLLKEK